MDAVRFVFVDTNVCLHFPPLAQIDWTSICAANAVRIVICHQVIQELDSKKGDSRLSGRASRAISEIRSAIRSRAEIRSGTTVEVFNHVPRSDDFDGGLSPSSGDDRIVQSARQFQRHFPDAAVAIATNDYGMCLRCEAGSVSAIEIDSSLRLDPPQDEQRQKIAQLQQQLAKHEGRRPTFQVFFKDVPADEPSEVAFLVDDLWKPFQFDKFEEYLRENHPKVAEVKPRSPSYGHLPPTLVHLAVGDPMVDWKNSEIRRYNGCVESFYEESRSAMKRYEAESEKDSRSVVFDVILVNDGTSKATDIDIVMTLPRQLAHVELVNLGSSGRARYALPDAPPPFREDQDYPPDYGSRQIASWIRGTNTTANLIKGLQSGSKLATIDRPADGTWVVTLKPPHLRHSSNLSIGRLKAEFTDYLSAAPFPIGVEVMSAELLEPVKKTVAVQVRRRSELAAESTDPC